MEAVSIRITGRVQGVGFRYFALNAAINLELEGWVKNMNDGSVLVKVRGPAARLDQFRTHLKKGPPFGRVDLLREEALSPQDTASFLGFQVTY